MSYYQKIKNYFGLIVWPLFVFSLHILSQSLGAYQYISWLDTPMHFFGGAAIAASSYHLFKHLEDKKELSTIPSFKFFMALAITALAAVIWEFSEYGGDLLFRTVMQPSIYDTMKDLCMGLLGATVVSTVKYIKKNSH